MSIFLLHQHCQSSTLFQKILGLSHPGGDRFTSKCPGILSQSAAYLPLIESVSKSYIIAIHTMIRNHKLDTLRPSLPLRSTWCVARRIIPSAVWRSRMNNMIARAALYAVICAAYNRRTGGAGIDTERQGWAGGCGERMGGLAVRGADALLADGFPVLLQNSHKIASAELGSNQNLTVENPIL